MKIGIILLHPFSDSMGSIVRVKELSKSLADLNVEVFIFSPFEHSFELYPKVHVISFGGIVEKLGLAKSAYTLSKSLYYTSAFPSFFASSGSSLGFVTSIFVKNLAKNFSEKNIDIIQVEQDAALPIGIALKKQLGLPLIVDIHNISSEELIANGVLNADSAQLRELQMSTKEGLSETDHVVVVSETMKEYVMRNYALSSSSVTVVPPGGRLKETISKDVTFPLRFVYAGLVVYREHVDLFVSSMPHVCKATRDAEFFITNKGNAVGSIKKLAHALQVKPEFFWFDDHSEVDVFLKSCHVGILPSSNDLARQMGTPVKLFNYLAAGLPIVANDIGGWSKMIETEKIGLLAPDSPKEFGEVLNIFIDNPRLIEEFAFNGYELIKNKYNWDNSARILLNTYTTLLEKN